VNNAISGQCIQKGLGFMGSNNLHPFQIVFLQKVPEIQIAYTETFSMARQTTI
jgi:hypothetical protein